MTKFDLSIVVLSYNTKEVLLDCLNSLEKVKKEAKFEVIVVDNASTDGSVDAIINGFPSVKVIQNSRNLGFAAGNNSARGGVQGKYVLFLNSDTLMKAGAIKKSLEYIKSDYNVGALTCRVLLKNGEDDPDTRRRFPTPWVAFSHFSKLDRLFPNSKFFSKYWIQKNPSEIQEIDVLQGAFALIPKEILDKIGWFDEDYFLDGEDIDLCWKIRQLGLKIIYYPHGSIIHLKGYSKGKNSLIRKSFSTRLKSVLAGLNSMEIFYRKRMWNRYPLFINLLVLAGINFMKSLRLIKLIFSI